MKVGRSLQRIFAVGILFGAFWLTAAAACLADAPAPAAPPAFDKGDNAWMLTSAALVLMMTGPGLALFYSGLVRKKNVLGVMMQCIFLMCLMSVIWAIYGYSLAFGGTGAWIGDHSYLFMRNVEAQWDTAHNCSVTPPCPAAIGASIPLLTHMLFQGMFFIITPALICGAFAERMKFSTMVVFMILWGTLVYCPLCHWVWGGGVLSYGSEHAKGISAGGALDFAGGTVVHISSGVSALILRLALGQAAGLRQRADAPAQPDLHRRRGDAALGRLVRLQRRQRPECRGPCRQRLRGDALRRRRRRADLGRHGMDLSRQADDPRHVFRHRRRLSLHHAGGRLRDAQFGAADGSGRGRALLFGLHGAEVAVPLRRFLGRLWRSRRGRNARRDPHGRFRHPGHRRRARGDKLLGLLEGGSVLKAQLIATGMAWGLAIVGTFVILKVLDAVMGLRVSREAEIEGLDFSQHGEEGYIFI